MYSVWPLVFCFIGFVGFVIFFALMDTSEGMSVSHVFTFILSVILILSNFMPMCDFIDTPTSEYLINASCTISNENYTVFKTEYGEYKVEGTYPYGKDYVLLMENSTPNLEKDKVLNIYSSDTNLLLESVGEKE